MIVPTKHISVAESILGFGAVLLEGISGSIHVDDLWRRFHRINNSKDYPSYQSFDNFILALDLLYIVGLIELEADGSVTRAIA